MAYKENLVSVKIEGADEIAKALREMDQTLRKRAYRSALNAGANVVLKKAQARVPVREGTLKKALTKRVSVTNNSHSAGVGWTHGTDAKHDAWYGHIVEYGSVNYEARPFVRPALDESESEIIKIYEEALNKAIDRLNQ